MARGTFYVKHTTKDATSKVPIAQPARGGSFAAIIG